MKINDGLKVFIKNLGNVEYEYTNGVLSVDIISNIDQYEGNFSTPDVGQLVLTSRNENLDPNVNGNVRFNSPIRIEVSDGVSTPTPNIFYGWITDINVEYRPKGEPPLITINAVDIIGKLQRHAFTEAFESHIRTNYPSGIGIADLFDEIYNQNEIVGFDYITWDLLYNPSPLNPSPVTAIKAGDSAYEVISKLMSSQLLITYVEPDTGRITIRPNPKYDQYNAYVDYTYHPGFDTYADYIMDNNPYFYYYNSNGTQLPYKSINIDDGFNRTINQVVLNNKSLEYLGGSSFTETSKTEGPYSNTLSQNDWGSARLNLDTLFSGANDIQATYDQLAYDIIEDNAQSTVEINSITVDGEKNFDPIKWFSFYGIVSIVIDHDVTPSINIRKLYDIVGIRHSIRFGEWTCTFILKVNDVYKLEANMQQNPLITMNAYTGNTNFNFTGTITGIALSSLRYIGWSYRASISGFWGNNTNFLTNVNFVDTNLTNTWNYDAGPGKEDYQGGGWRYVEAYLQTNSYWWRVAQTSQGPGDELTVTSAVPTANFSFTVNEFGTVTFTNLSYDNDTNSWDFGDGTTSTQVNPLKTYTNTGTYNVTLTVDNGIETASITKPVTINVIRIPVRWIKVEFNATRTQTGGVWDKYIPIQLGAIYPNGGGSGLDNKSVRYTATTGTVSQIRELGGPGNIVVTPWDASGTYPYIITDGPFNLTNYVQINPQVSGNTETINVTFYIRTDWESNSLLTNLAGLNAVFNSLRPAISGTPGQVYYESGKTYEKIKVYISEYNTTDFAVAMGPLPTWIEIGYFQNNISAAEYNQEYFYRAMTAIVPMPPQKSL